MTSSADFAPFLQGGGELGDLTRRFDWAKTSVGAPETWPQSLRTIVSLILNSRFPMFLWWGKDLLQFYNDAYRPSLGNDGKHPTALGQRAMDCWPEIWDVIDPLIKGVQDTGMATWSEDQLVPIVRNGRLEEVYWTFSYSPVRSESNQTEGVLVVCYETTDKVRTVQRLSVSEAHFQNLVKEASVGIIVLIGEEMTVAIVNNAYGNLINHTSEELMGKPLFDVIPQSEEHFKPIIEGVFRSGKPLYLYDHPYVVRKNEEISQGFLNLVYQPFRETDGQTTGVMILCQDVTEQVISRKKVERSERRFFDLVSEATVPTAVFMVPDMIVEVVNDPMLEIWGRDTSVIGRPLMEFMPELAGQPFPDLLRKVYMTGDTHSEQDAVVYIKRRGVLETIYMDFSYKPLKDLEGRITSIFTMAIDVTERVLSRKRLLQSEANLRNTILKAPVAMCILRGPQHIVEIANERMIELWGRTAAEVMDKPIFIGLPEAKNQGFEKFLEDVYTTGDAFVAQGIPITLFRGKHTQTVYVNFVYEAFRESDGSISGVTAVATDVTPQVLAHQKIEEMVGDRTRELAEANKKLQKSNAELAQFAHIASHDLQEPVRKVSIFAQMLEESLGDMSPKSKGFLDKINMSVARMLTLIRDVLAYSELAKEDIEFERVDLQKVISGIENDFELLIEQKGATIHVSVLPVIDGIALQMSQLFRNLLSNALKFTREGIAPEIHITCTSEKNRCMIDVKDNGIGFRQAHADQIFSIFQRLHIKTEYPGTGIGLAMCKKIVQNHHGDIIASGISGEGATFRVIIPIHQNRRYAF